MRNTYLEQALLGFVLIVFTLAVAIFMATVFASSASACPYPEGYEPDPFEEPCPEETPSPSPTPEETSTPTPTITPTPTEAVITPTPTETPPPPPTVTPPPPPTVTPPPECPPDGLACTGAKPVTGKLALGAGLLLALSGTVAMIRYQWESQ